MDFYNHDTKYSDVCIGNEPVYNTLFSFKNTVDSVYTSFIQKDFIGVDVFCGKVKLGSCRIALSIVVEKDFSFQTVNIEAGKYVVGRLFYRMRLRKDCLPIAEEKGVEKIVSISVLSCTNLKCNGSDASKPFFYFDFWNFQTQSTTMHGAAP